VSEQELWECVSNRKAPKRGFGADEIPAAALPAQLVHQLIHDLGIPEGEIVGMSLERATGLMIAYGSQPRT
jgi:hypothetical protein